MKKTVKGKQFVDVDEVKETSQQVINILSIEESSKTVFISRNNIRTTISTYMDNILKQIKI